MKVVSTDSVVRNYMILFIVTYFDKDNLKIKIDNFNIHSKHVNTEKAFKTIKDTKKKITKKQQRKNRKLNSYITCDLTNNFKNNKKVDTITFTRIKDGLETINIKNITQKLALNNPNIYCADLH